MEPEYNEGEYQDFGPEALDTEMPSIPFTEEQFRYNAMISQTDFLPYMADRVNNTPFTRAAKRSLTDFLAAFFNQSVILSHSTSVREATLRFDLAMISIRCAVTGVPWDHGCIARTVRVLDEPDGGWREDERTGVTAWHSGNVAS
jgi:hypothetical protein